MRTKDLVFAFGILLAVQCTGAETPSPRVLPLTDRPKPVVDGTVTPGEYAATFTDPVTGIAVSWQADTNNLYVALQSPGRGWVAIGFGKKGMRGSSMVIGFMDKGGQWTVEEQLGKVFHRHGNAKEPSLLAGKVSLQNGRTVMEFALPLALSDGKTIQLGEPMPFLLAYHESKTTLSKHSGKSSGELRLQAQTGTR